MAEPTIICRCEDITRAELMEAIAQGCETIDEIKRFTRAGMGPCQGRNCREIIARELAAIYKLPIEEVLMPTFRPPGRPVSLGALAAAEPEGGLGK